MAKLKDIVSAIDFTEIGAIAEDRIKAGESPDEVADAIGDLLDAITPFELIPGIGPVIEMIDGHIFDLIARAIVKAANKRVSQELPRTVRRRTGRRTAPPTIG